MAPRSPEPLRKCTLNLFDKDCDAMARRYGHGWSEEVRNLVRRRLKQLEVMTLAHEWDQAEWEAENEQ